MAMTFVLRKRISLKKGDEYNLIGAQINEVVAAEGMVPCSVTRANLADSALTLRVLTDSTTIKGSIPVLNWRAPIELVGDGEWNIWNKRYTVEAYQTDAIEYAFFDTLLTKPGARLTLTNKTQEQWDRMLGDKLRPKDASAPGTFIAAASKPVFGEASSLIIVDDPYEVVDDPYKAYEKALYPIDTSQDSKRPGLDIEISAVDSTAWWDFVKESKISNTSYQVALGEPSRVFTTSFIYTQFVKWSDARKEANKPKLDRYVDANLIQEWTVYVRQYGIIVSRREADGRVVTTQEVYSQFNQWLAEYRRNNPKGKVLIRERKLRSDDE